MYRFLFIAFIAVFITSCEKQLSVKLPEEPVRPVLNAFMNQDSAVVARVTLSGRDLDDNGQNSKEPGSAVLKLYEDGNFIETLHDTVSTNEYDGKKYYKSYTSMKQGKTYKLTLETPGYNMAEGSDYIPAREQIAVSDRSVFYTPTEYGYNNTNFRFTIINKGAAKCFYRFRMSADSSYYVDQGGDTVYNGYANQVAIKAQNNGLSVFGESYVDANIGGVYSVQALEPGESRIITLTAENVEYMNGRFLLEVSVLTNDSYDYLFSLNNVLKNDDDPTAEKQNVICNVRNGFGIVGGMAIQQVVFRQ